MLFQLCLALALLAPFAGSVAILLTPLGRERPAALTTAGFASASFLLLAPLYPEVSGGGNVRLRTEWLPELGAAFTLRIDGFSWLFACLVAGMGALVALYARHYMSPRDPLRRFFATLLAFMGAMLGVVLSGDLIQLVFFWELTSLFSFLLIGYWGHKAAARAGARMALTVTVAGGLCLLAGVLLLGKIVGSFDLDRILVSGDVIRASALYRPTLLLVAIGALTKSAQFPFQFWLPNAMAAPTPVSAYLHSATMVKAGVFLLIRLWPALGSTDDWLWLIGGAGLVTFVLGAFLAMFQQDMKALLAYSTMSHLGLITLLTGLDSAFGQIAAIFHIINHAAFKASLFMAVGVVDHETGTRDLRKLSGLRHYMPITATLAIVAAAAMAGVPLLNGFLSKEMFFAETVKMHDYSAIDYALPYIVTVASAFSVIYSLRFIRDVFFGSPARDLPREPHEAPPLMRFPAEALVFICLAVGMAPAWTIGPMLASAARSVVRPELPYYSLSVWHGLTPELGMSVVATLAGVIGYIFFHRRLLAANGAPLFGRIDTRAIFEAVLDALTTAARWLEGALSTVRLQPQLRLAATLAVLFGLAPFLLRAGVGPGPLRTAFDPLFALIWVVGAACALGAAAVAEYRRLAALIMLGGAGVAVGLTFVWLSAPDLAVTQLVVETVTTVLLMLGLRWLPQRPRAHESPAARRLRLTARASDLGIAVAVGCGLGGLAYLAMTRPAPEGVSRYFVENAYTQGGGTNIVNVILVDFRSFDTFGEIVVLGAVALVVFALLRRFRPAPDDVGEREPMAPEPGLSMLLKLSFPLITAVAIYLLLRGHDLPGGGFAGGVAMACAFVVQYMAFGADWTESHLRVRPVRWIGLGLLAALATGWAATLFGRPFLTSYYEYAVAPIVGKIPVSSAFAFDLGVFAIVVGATALMLIALSHQSIRSHRFRSRRRARTGEA